MVTVGNRCHFGGRDLELKIRDVSSAKRVSVRGRELKRRKPCQCIHREDLQQLESLQNSFKGYFYLDLNEKGFKCHSLRTEASLLMPAFPKLTSLDLRIKALLEPDST